MANTVFVLLFMVASSLCFVCGDEKSEMLLDFTTLPSLRGWIETSDLIRRVGMSKAVFVLQRTKVFQRAVLFTMLNPQPDGAGYAGFRTDTNFNLTQWTSLQLRCRGQGDHHGYKIALRHRSETDPKPSYELMFQFQITMKGYSVSLDIWKMIMTCLWYLALAFTAWVFLRLLNACLWLPTFLTKYQNKNVLSDETIKQEQKIK